MSYENRKMDNPYFYEDLGDGFSEVTDSVKELFETNKNGQKVISISNLKKLRFELGGSPFTTYTTFRNGSFDVDECLLEDETDWDSDMCNPMEYVLYLGNTSVNVGGGSLIINSLNISFDDMKDEYMTEDYLKMSCLICMGEVPYHVWVEGEV